MATTSTRRLTAFRLNTRLLDRLKQQAKEENRSLNNYVEYLLMNSVYREPNAETVEAIEEARSGAPMETLDLEKLK